MSEQRIATLDLLRGIAAFSVAISHYFMLNSTEWPGAQAVSILSVEVFFVLSGFVLAPQIIFCCRDARPINLFIFLSRRWMRTIPPFAMALAAISIVTGQLFNHDFFRYLLYAQNFFAQHNTHDYFPVAWSLSIEEWFYVVFPFLAVVCTVALRRNNARFHAMVAVGFILTITAVRTVFGSFENWDEVTRRVVVFRIDSIAYGFLLYVLISRYNRDSMRIPRYVAVAFALIAFVGCSIFAFYVAKLAISDTAVVSQSVYPFSSELFGMSTILAFYMLQFVADRSRGLSSIFVFMGRISYSVYLFHLIIIMFLRPHLQTLPYAVQLLIYIGCLVAFSSVFYRYFERQILAARPTYKSAADGSVRTRLAKVTSYLPAMSPAASRSVQSEQTP